MASPAGVHTLEVILTASCNLRCGYCYQNTKQARHMDWATLQAALDLLLGSGQPSCTVLFIGGEPLLQLPLIERAVAYVQANLPQGKRIQHVLATNGTLLDRTSLAFFAAHDFEVQVSFDGVPAAQSFRGVGTHKKLDGVFDMARRDLPGFARSKMRVAMTLHSGNVRYLAESVDYFLDKDISRILISPLTTHDAGWTPTHVDELRRQFERVFDRSVAHYHATGEVPVGLFRKTDDGDHHRPSGLSMCGVGRGEAIAVDVDGQVTGCVTFAESYQRPDNDFLRKSLESMRMGSIHDAALPERMAGFPAATRATRIFHGKEGKYSSFARCGECRYFAECSVCPTSIGHIPGSADPNRVPDAACAFNLVTLELKARFPRQARLSERLAGRAWVPALVQEFLERTGPRPVGSDEIAT